MPLSYKWEVKLAIKPGLINHFQHKLISVLIQKHDSCYPCVWCVWAFELSIWLATFHLNFPRRSGFFFYLYLIIMHLRHCDLSIYVIVIHLSFCDPGERKSRIAFRRHEIYKLFLQSIYVKLKNKWKLNLKDVF